MRRCADQQLTPAIPQPGYKRQPGCLTDDPAMMAELFVSLFASVFTSATPGYPFPHQVFDGTLSQIEMAFEYVHSALKDPAATLPSAMGPDKIQSHVLKACADELAYHCRSFSQDPLWRVSYLPVESLPLLCQFSKGF